MLSYRLEAFARPLVETRTELPAPQGRQVIVDVAACGLCHSDVHLHDGYFDLGGGQKLEIARGINPPRILGHEIVGTVSAVGPEVRDAKIGDRRVVYPWIGCGTCAMCASGNEQLCAKPAALGVNRDGGFATRVLVPDERYLVEFAPLPEVQACTYACSGLTAYAALKKLLPFPRGGKLLIIGAGGVGLSGVRFARALGLPAPIVAEVDKSKWDLARQAGASECIDPTAEGAVRALMAATGGGVMGAVDFVGAGQSFAFGFSALAKGGKLVAVGLFGGASPIAPALVTMKAVTIVGSYVGSLDEMRELMTIARSGVLPELPVATRPLREVNAALTDLKEGRVRGRIVLMP